MRILIHGINYAPEVVGIGKYSGEMAQWLAQQGNTVRVITAPPYYPYWKILSGYLNWYNRTIEDGVSIWRCPLWIPKKPSGLTRIVHLASFAITSFPIMLFQIVWRPDVVIAIEPPVFCAPQALLVARLSNAIAWLHIQDFEVDAAFSLGILKNQTLRRWVGALDRGLTKCFDRVSTISGAMLQLLHEKELSTAKTVFFPNWVDTTRICPDREAGRSFRMALGIEEHRVVALYSGNLGFKQGLDILIEAARILQEIPIQFLICGEGVARRQLEIVAVDLPYVRFLPLQPIEQFNALLNCADIHLLPQRADAADLVMPSKLGGILACGGAVIAIAQLDTEVGQTVKEAGGILCPSEDPVQFADAIRSLASNESARKQMGEQARAFAVAKLGKEAILYQFGRALQSYYKGPERAANSESQFH